MIINPPSFKFYGNLNKAKLLKSEGLQFYNFVTTQAEKEGLSFINRSKILHDGSIISIVSSKSSIYETRSGVVTITAIPTNNELILSNILVTVADRVSIDATLSDPFQKRKSRLLFDTSKIKFSKDDFLAIGKNITTSTNTIDLPFQEPAYPSIGILSEWRSSSKAMTYIYRIGAHTPTEVNVDVFYYIGGLRFESHVVLPYSVLHVTNGPAPVLYCACYVPMTDNIRSQYPSLDGYSNIIVSLFATDLSWTLVINGVDKALGISEPIYVPVTLPVFTPTTTISDISVPMPLSGFNFEGRTLLIANIVDSSNTNQSVYKVVFDETYQNNTSTLIYQTTPYYETLNTTTTISGEVVDESFVYNYLKTRTISFTPGDPVITHLLVDIDNKFYAIRHNTSDHTLLETTHDSSSGTRRVEYNENSVSNVEIIKFTNDGFKVIKNIPDLTREVSKILEDSSSPLTRIYTDLRKEKLIEINFYSGFKNLILYKLIDFQNNHTYSGDYPFVDREVIHNRYMILDTGSSIVLDSYLSSENPFSIFPSIPSISISIEDVGTISESSIIYPKIGTGSDRVFTGIGVEEFFTIRTGSIVVAYSTKQPIIMIDSAANNNFLLSCYSVGDTHRTLLLDWTPEISYSKLNYRLDQPVTADSIFLGSNFFYPIGITTTSFK